jgi:predicted nucleic acid-binding protein
MQQEFKAVIADTSCFILLDKIEALHILHQVFNEIITSEKIAAEFGKKLPAWIQISEVQNQNLLKDLMLEVDAGEASAITLATELHPSLLIIDDLKGRKLAKELHLTYTGTLGVFLKARQKNIISSLRPYFEKIKKTNFHISHQLLDDILKQVND